MFDAAIVRRWAKSGVELLAKHRDELNALNVFPIPDGDTGTNLYLTFKAAAEAEISRTGRLDDAQDALNAMARGALLGARGNSGVILAQTLRAFSLSAQQSEHLNLATLIKAGAKAARSAVSNPQEGTALTVLDAVANSNAEDPSSAGEIARLALSKTPEMLPALKQAGVVDAGGRGVVLLLDALAAAWNQKPNESPAVGFVPSSVPSQIVCDADGKFELMFLVPTISLSEITKVIQNLGSSLVITSGEDVSQVHIHLDDPSAAIDAISNIATAKNIRIELLETKRRERAVIVQAFGSGVVQMLAEVGAFVVPCEPNARSSVSEFVDAAIRSESKEVVLVAGDKDSIQVTELAAKHLKDIGIQASVVPATTIPAALVAVSMFEESGSLQIATDKMISAIWDVKSVGITIANRDSSTPIGQIATGDFLLLVDGEIQAHSKTFLELIPHLVGASKGKEIATLIWGSAIAEDLKISVVQALVGLEIIEIDGNQDLWQLMAGFE
jgi:DAK2 domain fusion protein YloV